MDILTNLISPGITALIISVLTIKFIKPVAIDFGLVDKPSERKQHNGVIPLIGGISIFISVLLTSLLWLPVTDNLTMFLIASALMVTIGAVDDRYDVSVRLRILIQLIIASLMIFGVNTYIENLGNIFMLGELHLGWLGVVFTYLAVLASINAFNMVDGIDGLVGSLSVNTFISITFLFFYSGHFQLATLPLITSIAILSYLIFNLAKPNKHISKIFMGDAGSMLIGFTVIWFLAFGTQGENSSFRPVTALWLITVPLIDMLAIVFRRIKKGQNPFKPDRDHLHHIFMRIGYSDRQALVFITAISLLFSAFGIAGEIYQIPEVIMLGLFVALYFVFHLAIKHIGLIVKILNNKSTTTKLL